MRRPFGSVTGGHWSIQKRLLRDASNRLKSDGQLVSIILGEIDLRAWNILIRNLLLADPEYLRSDVLPSLNSYDESAFERLLAEADLFNISKFCHWFSKELLGLAQW